MIHDRLSSVIIIIILYYDFNIVKIHAVPTYNIQSNIWFFYILIILSLIAVVTSYIVIVDT